MIIARTGEASPVLGCARQSIDDEDMATTAAPLGILAGGGGMPIAVAQAASDAGRPVHIVAIKGEADETVQSFDHTWIEWGEVGRMLKAFEHNSCHELVIIGSVTRPDLGQVRFDLGALRNLPSILALTVGGDDSVLSNVVRFFEAKGFVVRGAHEIAEDLVLHDGVAGTCQPRPDDMQDIAKAFQVVDALGAYDVGQATVVVRGHVLAVEAAEGTDSMLERAADLRQWGRARSKKRMGVLAKAPKPAQELRVDMPAIGPRTVTLAAEAGLAGLALKSGGVLIAEREATIAEADRLGLFIYGEPHITPPTHDQD